MERSQSHRQSRYSELRTSPRSSISLAAVIRRPGGPAIDVVVRNVSSGGMMAECTVPFQRGESILSELRGLGTVGGRIAWATHGRIGVAFDRAVDPALAV